MMIMMKTASPKQTFRFGVALAGKLKKGFVLCLAGDLGAGKTLFVQGIAEGLEVQEDVTSPTFSLMNIYEGKFAIYHFDLYRLDFADELEDVGFYEYAQQEDGLAIIEWPDKFKEEMPDEHIWIEIARGQSENDRLFSISLSGNKYEGLDEELKEICRF